MRRGPLLAAGLAALVVATAAAAGPDRLGRLLLAAGRPDLAAAVFADPAWTGFALARAGRHAEAAEAFRHTRDPAAAFDLGNALARSGDLAAALTAYDLALARNPDDADARLNRAVVEKLLKAAEAEAPAEPGGTANSGSKIDHDSSSMDTADKDATAVSSLGDGMVGDRQGSSTNDAAGSGNVSRRGAARSDDTAAGEGTSSGSATDAAGRAGSSSGGPTDAAEADDADRRRRAEASARQEETQATLQWLAAIPDDPGRWLRLRITSERKRRVEAGVAVQPGGEDW